MDDSFTPRTGITRALEEKSSEKTTRFFRHRSGGTAQVRRSPRTAAAEAASTSARVVSTVHKQRDLGAKLNATVGEATPRTLIDNFVSGHDTVQTSTRKRPRVDKTPSPGRLLSPRHDRSARRTPASLRKKATMRHFIRNQVVEPTPRGLIENFLMEAPEEETPVAGVVTRGRKSLLVANSPENDSLASASFGQEASFIIPSSQTEIPGALRPRRFDRRRGKANLEQFNILLRQQRDGVLDETEEDEESTKELPHSTSSRELPHSTSSRELPHSTSSRELPHSIHEAELEVEEVEEILEEESEDVVPPAEHVEKEEPEERRHPLLSLSSLQRSMTGHIHLRDSHTNTSTSKLFGQSMRESTRLFSQAHVDRSAEFGEESAIASPGKSIHLPLHIGKDASIPRQDSHNASRRSRSAEKRDRLEAGRDEFVVSVDKGRRAASSGTWETVFEESGVSTPQHRVSMATSIGHQAPDDEIEQQSGVGKDSEHHDNSMTRGGRESRSGHAMEADSGRMEVVVDVHSPFSASGRQAEGETTGSPARVRQDGGETMGSPPGMEDREDEDDEGQEADDDDDEGQKADDDEGQEADDDEGQEADDDVSRVEGSYGAPDDEMPDERSLKMLNADSSPEVTTPYMPLRMPLVLPMNRPFASPRTPLLLSQHTNVDKPAAVPTSKQVAPKKKRAAPPKSKYPRMPTSLTRSIFTHFAGCKVDRDAIAEVEKVADDYWKNLTRDLTAYAAHANRHTVNQSDVELLMRRQGFVTDKVSMYSLVEQYLPLEYRQEIIPVARSGNVVVPRH